MTYAEWIRDSARGAFTPRSTALKAIDTALERYERLSSLVNLNAVAEAIAAWKLSKGRMGAWANSERNVQVRRLSNWVQARLVQGGWYPLPEVGWGLDHNCYAYGATCRPPTHLPPDNTGGHSIPGGAAGHIAMPGGDGEHAYHQRLIQGVVADGQAQGRPVLHVAQVNPNPVPANRGGHYLLAMVGFGMGFHFLRRDTVFGRWSHKNGPPASPETTVYSLHDEKTLSLTDEVVLPMLTEATKARYESGFAHMKFIAYFHVPHGGIWVGRNRSYAQTHG
jgi:hypothetical protein